MPLNKDVENILDPILATLGETLTTTIIGQLAEVYIAGQAEMITWGKTKAGIPIAYEGPPPQKAIDWARQHISRVKLVDGINAETKKQISNVVADGIKSKRGIPGITSDIRHKFDWMARGAPSEIRPGLTLRSRAEMIARTETAEALSQASLDSINDMGIEGKEWVWAGEDCDICEENEAEGVVPTNHVFSSGHERPPAHPNCICALAPARLPK